MTLDELHTPWLAGHVIAMWGFMVPMPFIRALVGDECYDFDSKKQGPRIPRKYSFADAIRIHGCHFVYRYKGLRLKVAVEMGNIALARFIERNNQNVKVECEDFINFGDPHRHFVYSFWHVDGSVDGVFAPDIDTAPANWRAFWPSSWPVDEMLNSLCQAYLHWNTDTGREWNKKALQGRLKPFPDFLK
jgi:hypothetical protein